MKPSLHMLFAVGKGKGRPDDSEPSDSEQSDLLDEMWDAIQDDDKESFGHAMRAYVMACMPKNKDDDEGDYE